jgi:hypothetical protein
MEETRGGSRVKRPLAERFWEKVDKRGPDECWEWQGARNEHGYGWFGPTHGEGAKAHRVAWELTNGPIPEGLCALHHCDNPPCCNPGHLFLGTKRDNTLDMWAKGRGRQPQLPGELNGRALLTAHQVSEIRRRAERGELQRVLAREFRVSRQAVSRIVLHQTWKEVAA